MSLATESGPPGGRNLRFERLARAVRDLSAARSHAAIVDVVRCAAREMTGSLGVAIVLREEGQCHYIAEDSSVPLWSGQRFPVASCISGWSMLNNRQAIIADIYQDERIPHEAYRPTGIHSLIMTPVGAPRPFAALGAYWGEVRHASTDDIAALAALASCMATALENIDLVSSLRAEADHKQLLINELNHRVKNTLAIVQSLAAQTARSTRTAGEARAEFESRLMALSAAQNLIIDASSHSVSVEDLLEATVRPFRAPEVRRFIFEGPQVMLPSKSAIAFALAIHEFCTNAAKYGALSAPAGAVDVTWTLDPAADRLDLAWREQGGPPVLPPEHRGFGARLLERGLAGELRGRIHLDFRPDGLVCEMNFPIPPDENGALFPLP